MQQYSLNFGILPSPCVDTSCNIIETSIDFIVEINIQVDIRSIAGRSLPFAAK
jgi:hypothetical protein